MGFEIIVFIINIIGKPNKQSFHYVYLHYVGI